MSTPWEKKEDFLKTFYCIDVAALHEIPLTVAFEQ